jgi:hypothetical protein
VNHPPKSAETEKIVIERVRETIPTEKKRTTSYALQRRSVLRWNSVIRSLGDLVETGWVLEVPTNPHKYKINEDYETVGHLLEFLSRALG